MNIDGSDPINLIPKKYEKKNFFCFYPRMMSNEKLLSFQGKIVRKYRRTYYSVYILDLERKTVRSVVKDGFSNTEPNVYVR